MKRTIMLVFVSIFMSVGVALAQSDVTGVVLDENGEPVIGASVVVVGTRMGTVTDANGRFSLKSVPKGSNVKFSYIGMNDKVLKASSSMKVELTSFSTDLDDVVVVAYGTQRKTTLTGSIQEVKSEQIEMRPTSSVASALEGTVSGVQVNSTYGAPGSDPSIRIRGIGTVNGSSSPLYILDGVPYGGNISDLNPSDIESMSVLKDAASAALYGNRASNGVILITTKKGRRGKLNLSLDIKQGTYSRGIKEYERVGVRDFMNMEWQNLKNSRMTNNGEDAATAGAYASANLISDMLYLNIFNKADDELFDENGKLVSDAQIYSGYTDDLDWSDQAIRSGYRQEYNINANGASDNADYLLSLGYLSEDGYTMDSGFDRISARVAGNISPKKWLKLGINLNATHQNFDNTNGSDGDSFTNVFMYTRYIAPIYPVHLHDVTNGEYILDANGNKQYDPGYYTDSDGNSISTRNQYVDRHVIWENELDKDRTVRNTINGTAYATLELPYGFAFTLKGNLNVRNNENQTYDNSIIGDGQGNNGRARRIDYRYKNYTFQQQLTWYHDYGKHHVDALVGHENYSYKYNYLYGYKTNEVFEGRSYMDNFTDITSLTDYNNYYRTESYLGRARYGYDDKYNGEVSFRRDGSSRFSKDARWGNFWSIGANWVISKEEFMKPYTWVNFLKLRADYGEVGNDSGSGLYGYMALYTSDQNANQGAYYISQLPNNDLKWEKGQSWGVAVDARLFNRWNLSIEYFDKRNKDLLFDVYQPLSAGGTSTSAAVSVVTRNIGTISNRGIEITTDVDAFKNKDWKINLGFNCTFLKNKVLKLPEQNKDGIISGTKKIVEGKDRYAFYVYTWEGIDTYNGRSLYKFNDEDYYFTLDDVTYGNTENGSELSGSSLDNLVVIDGVPYSYNTTYAKREFHGSAIPDMYGSFSLNVSWKSLSLNALFTTQLGAKVMDYNYQSLMYASGTPRAIHKDALKSWTTDDATETHTINRSGVPVYNYNLSSDNNATSSRFLISGNYLILKNLSFVYQLPSKWVRALDLSNISVSATCENLFTWTKRRGLNPQQSFDGTQDNYLVTPRVFSMGINVKF